MSINVIFFKPSIQPIVFLMTRSFESAAQQLSLSLSLSLCSASGLRMPVQVVREQESFTVGRPEWLIIMISNNR